MPMVIGREDTVPSTLPLPKALRFRQMVYYEIKVPDHLNAEDTRAWVAQMLSNDDADIAAREVGRGPLLIVLADPT